jgi:hypothetical protein
MKIRTYHAPQAGNVFLITMMLTGIFCLISLGSYLSMTSTENTMVMRSLAWNTALPLAEAGVEEALSHIVKNTANFAVDGWTPQGTNLYAKQGSLSTGYYTVNIAGSPGTVATITSTGHALFQGANYVSRTVQVKAQSGPFLPCIIGLVAKNNITFGGALGVDSYDSTYGLYGGANVSDQAIVATPIWWDSISGNSHIYGYVEAAPKSSPPLMGGTATVGDKAWVSGKHKGIQSSPTNHFSANFTNAIPDVPMPYTSAAAPSSGTVSNTSYNYVLNGGNYMATNLNAGGGSTTMIVTAPSTLVVSGDITLANVVFAPGASLDLVIATPSISFHPTIQDMSGGQTVTPIQFRVWGLPSCTSMDMTSAKSFTGVIYAPEADLKAAGNAAFYGAFTANTFTCNGTFDFHYDVSTANYKAGGPSFKVSSWAELVGR